MRRAPLSVADPTAGELEHPPVTDVENDHPLLRLVNLRDLTVLRARAWVLPEPAAGSGDGDPWRWSAPVRSLEHPLVVAGERGRSQRFVAMAFGAADSDLPLRVAFPLFVRNAVNWLAGRDAAADAQTDGVRAGDPVRLAAGETLWTRAQHDYGPIGEVLALERVSGPAIFQPMQAGFYLRHRADGSDAWLAVNTFDRAMSALNVPASAAPRTANNGPGPTAATGWEAVSIWPPWVYLALAGFVLSALEWWGFHRRRTE